MITDEQVDKIVDRLIARMEEANTVFLKSVGSSIKAIKEVSPTEAHKLIQILKYGGNYEKMVRKIAKYANMNIKDIDKIFAAYAKEDQLFYKQFYKYKNIPFVPYDKNPAIQSQTMAIAGAVKSGLYDFTRENVLGYTMKGKFVGMRDAYNKMLDTALMNVSQGKETFDAALNQMIKDVGSSGLKTLEFESGKHMLLASAMRMHLKDGLRTLHNENQKIYGKEFDSDGVEITVHLNPAPDHALVQGRQFTNEEFDKFQNDEDARSYDGMFFSAISEETGHDRRAISEYNCYHEIFPILLGVSKPNYTSEELQQIIDDNEKGFTINGKHYTNYEGTQLQRLYERKIREQKNIQILAKESDNKNLIGYTQGNITKLTNEYNELSKTSGLPTMMERARVGGYRRQDVSDYVADKKIVGENQPLLTTLKSGNIIIPAGSEIENVRIIAGYKTSTPIKTIEKLYRDFPQYKQIWQKKVGTVTIKGKSYQVHWYSNGGNEYYHKIKGA